MRQTYNETNPFSVATAIPAGQDGIWDFALTFSEDAQTTGAYCLKATTSTNEDLNSYEVIPSVSVPVSSYAQSNYRFYENADSLTPGAPLAAQNTSATVTAGKPFRLRQAIEILGGSLPSHTALKLQFAEKVTTCSVASYIDMAPNSDALQVSTGYTEGATDITELSDDGGMASIRSWTNPGNIATADGLFASWVQSSGLYDSSELQVSGFPVTVPTNATITGLQVRVTGNTNGKALMINAGTEEYHVVDGTLVLGGTTDAPSSASADSINDGSFRVSFMTSGVQEVYLDSVAINAHYTAPASSATAVNFYDNPSLQDRAIIEPVANDPTVNGILKYMTYHEGGQFTNSSLLNSGDVGLWDFSLTSTEESVGKTYCVRAINIDGSELDSYAQYPEITVETASPAGPTLQQQLRGGQTVVNGVKSPFTW